MLVTGAGRQIPAVVHAPAVHGKLMLAVNASSDDRRELVGKIAGNRGKTGAIVLHAEEISD